MSGTIEAKLAELGVTLPDAPAPAANYVPFVKVGDIVYVSGQISQDPTGLIKGKLGADMEIPAGAAAAAALLYTPVGPRRAQLQGAALLALAGLLLVAVVVRVAQLRTEFGL